MSLDSSRRTSRKRDLVAENVDKDVFPFSPEGKRNQPKRGKPTVAPQKRAGAASPKPKRVASTVSASPKAGAASPKHKRVASTEAKQTTGKSQDAREVEDLLSETKRNTEYEKLLEDKDKAYSALYEKYSKLKSSFSDGQGRMLADVAAKAEQSEKLAGTTIQTLKAQLTAANTKLKQSATELAKLTKQVDDATKSKDKLAAELLTEKETVRDLVKLEETYRLLTATHIVRRKKKDDMYRCTLVKQDPFRVCEFDLTCKEVDISYQPVKINLKGTPYPAYLKDRIKFVPAQTPLLMRNLLNTVYTPNPPNPHVFTPTKY